MDKKIRFIADKTLILMVIVATLAMTLAVIWVLSFINEDTVEPDSDVISVKVTFIVMLVFWYISVLMSAPRILCIVTLTNESITVWYPFSTKKTYGYKQYPYVYIGGYFHGHATGLGGWVKYIVLSQRILSTEELLHINNISNIKTVIRIRYSKRKYETLCSILPPRHKAKLIGEFSRVNLNN